MEQVVIDSSVLAKLFLDEEHSEKAQEIKDAYWKQEIWLSAPSLIVYELINILECKGFAQDKIMAALKASYDYDFELKEIDRQLADFIAGMALRHRITAYDAAYVALASIIGATFYTADRKLVDKTKGLGFVKHIGSFGNYSHG
jgi:predicted nucleic acid-binding protein